MICYELLTGCPPFIDGEGCPERTKLLIQNTDLEALEGWTMVSEEFREFLGAILEKDCGKRVGAGELLEMSIFKEILE